MTISMFSDVIIDCNFSSGESRRLISEKERIFISFQLIPFKSLI